MAKASDNPYPSLLIAESGAPAAPAAGYQRLFVDPTDHVLKRVNSAGAVTSVEAAGAAAGVTKIGGVVLGSTASTISFTSIPAIYEDLFISLLNIASTANNSVQIRFNNDSAANYDWTRFYGTGASVGSDGTAADTGGTVASVGAAAPGLNAARIDIGKYARTNAHKVALSTNARIDAGTGLPIVLYYAARWRNTAAINRIDLVALTNSFAAGTVATLYGTAA